ncbi:hypothetical protein D920_03077 [Enterococcus faecalis 13-SD-W-01]|nr:hypothetical protein D920_03077 [Enterococcus faecalis 13-SD-W-01]
MIAIKIPPKYVFYSLAYFTFSFFFSDFLIYDKKFKLKQLLFRESSFFEKKNHV